MGNGDDQRILDEFRHADVGFSQAGTISGFSQVDCRRRNPGRDLTGCWSRERLAYVLLTLILSFLFSRGHQHPGF